MFYYNKCCKNSIDLLGPNLYLKSVIKYISIGCRCQGYAKSKTINPPLPITTIQEVCFIFTQDFIIPVSNLSTIPITLWE